MINENDTITLTGVRVTYPHLMKPQEPRPGSKGVAKFNLSFILQANDPQVKEIDDYVNRIMEAKWPGSSTTLKPTLAKNARFWGKGAEAVDPKTMAIRPGYDDPGCWYYGAKNPARPAICNPATGQPYPPENEMVMQQAIAKIYGGCYATVKIDPYAYAPPGGAPGLFCTLVELMFERDGERLGGGAKAATGFAPIAGAPPPVAGGGSFM